jgi:hypothetical protein
MDRTGADQARAAATGGLGWLPNGSLTGRVLDHGVMPPILVIGAFGAAGYMLFKMLQGVQQDDAKLLAFRAANGWSFDEIAGELTSGFDQDGDGRLAFDVVKGARMLGESTMKRVDRRWTEPHTVLGLPTGATAVRELHATHSIEPMLRKADADRDGIATRAEMAALLRTFDADANGRLSSAERGQAIAALGKVLISREERTVRIEPATRNPTPTRA